MMMIGLLTVGTLGREVILPLSFRTGFSHHQMKRQFVC